MFIVRVCDWELHQNDPRNPLALPKSHIPTLLRNRKDEGLEHCFILSAGSWCVDAEALSFALFKRRVF